NERVYDPLTAQFFSPDPFVQAPDNWLNYNRYGYCLNNPLIYTDPDGELVWWAIAAIIYGVFFTEPGYQLQKYISPIAYKVELDFGSHQSGIGIKGGVGVPKVASIFGANANWYEGSAKYYWKDYGDYKGWEFTYGKETTKWGVITEGNTNVIKKNGVKDYSQSVGYKKYGIPGLLAVEHYNDAWGNDVSDKYNTATSKIIVGPFSLENVIFTGEPKIGQDGEYKKTEKTGIFGNKYSVYDEEEDSPRHGILALRIGSFRIGGDSERIRATIQNGYHTILGDPYFQYKPYTPRWFFQFGW
ncbi:MAG: polymorphic toxin type 23 domain-containing protein, partial [Bacteroidales bacterium]